MTSELRWLVTDDVIQLAAALTDPAGSCNDTFVKVENSTLSPGYTESNVSAGQCGCT